MSKLSRIAGFSFLSMVLSASSASSACYQDQTPTSNSRAQTQESGQIEMEVVESVYGTTNEGQQVRQFHCVNQRGNSITLIDYGATMTSIMMPGRDGQRANLILTCSDMDAWQKCQSYFGGSVGRFCNRIAKGKFSIDGQPFTLAVNNGPNHLHGGVKGFDKIIWNAEPIKTDSAVGVRFTCESADGDEGYPGKLDVIAEYMLTNDDELSVEFRARTDKVTPVNLTNHNYWNLAGHDSGKHFDQELKIEADTFLAIDSTLIPTGELLDVADTEFDFRESQKIGERVENIGDDAVKGYDHCYSIRDFDGAMRLAATVHDPASGRAMEIHTTQPGLQFYTGNFLDGGEGSGGYGQYSAFCLETQHFPDSPNQPDFPTTLLQPGDEYVEKTVHKFSIRE